MKITALKLHDENFGDEWSRSVKDRWDYSDMKNDDRWRRGWISFDCALYAPEDRRVYLGITSFDGDIFRAYDRDSGRFIDLGYDRVADPFDAKFHRSLERGADGCLYAAVALLHCVDRYQEAPGGAIVRYDPTDGSISKLSTPVPHTYIQAITYDADRGLIHALCFAPEKLVTYDLKSGSVTDHGLIGTGIGGMCQTENLCLDDRGRCWSNWQLTRAWQYEPGVDAHRLCRINPEGEGLEFFQHGLPRIDGKRGTTKGEAFFNLGDGVMYASGDNGSLFRFDPETAEAEFLFTPVADRPSRLTSLVVANDGNAYGITGREGKCELLRFDFRENRYDLLGTIADAQGEAMWQCHHLVLTDDGVLFACENDNPHRSGYLWQIEGAFE